MTDNIIGQWLYIPEPAFHYFPQGQQIIIPNHKKPEQQWRKIFGGGQQYSPFENNALAQLEKQLVNERKEIDPFFTKTNKLRFLQANKFKVEKTIQSMQENTKWRKKEFPIHSDPKTERLLASGAFYFCGRDSKYRPILVVDIGKFEEDAEKDGSIQKALVLIMEFMINWLLIEGQVENYCLVMDLDTAGFGNRGIIMDILSFTGNAYRGRLFVSYLLSMPTVIRWGWDGIVSNFISENTRRKIKITGDTYHNDMWTHIDRSMIEHRFGGDMPNIQGAYWPPKKELLLFTSPEADAQNRLISSDQYFNRFKDNRLENRKILRKLVQKQTKAEIAIRESIEQESAFLKNVRFRTQTQMEVDNKVVSTFFQCPSFQKICHDI